MQSHRLIVLGRAAHVSASLSSLSDHNGYDVSDPCNSSKDAVHDWAVCRIIGELETETTIDDTKGNEDTTKPDVSMRSRSPRLELLVVGVMEGTKDWLEECEDEENDTDNGVRLVDLEMRLVW